MKKIFSLLVIISLFICIFAGCANNTATDTTTVIPDDLEILYDLEPISEETIREIIAALDENYKEFNVATSKNYFDTHQYQNVYYGTIKGYVVFFHAWEVSPSISHFGLWIGDYFFSYPHHWHSSILVYKDGNLEHLENAYRDGIFTDENIALLEYRHNILNPYGEPPSE